MRFSFVIMLLVLMGASYALTASPASHNSNYGDGEQRYSLTITNDEQRSLSVTLTPTGPLAQYITVPTEITLGPGEQKSVPVILSMPVSTQPGVLESGILIESRPVSAGTVSATSAVMHVIRVTTPKEGEFVAGELLVSSGIVHNPLAVTLVLENTGSVQTSGAVQFAIAGQSFSDQAFTLQPAQVSNVVVYWTPQRVGEYLVEATVSYAGKEETYQSQVIIGNLSVDIASIELSDFRLGDPFRVHINAKSEWGAPITVVASVAVDQGNGTVQSGSSTAVRAEPLTTTRIPVFIESAGLMPGVAFMSTSVVYAGQNKTTIYPVVIGVDSISFPEAEPRAAASKAPYVIGVLILLLLVGILLTKLLKKQYKER
jgi:hypothetical protein